ncbi:FadR family transcriptional regulator [Arthrobacter sp. AK01]|uniref:FadR/GntR family transcriptional regulator n=1 Tax=Micrococcaceae TaxID=1268 RepID=UPI001E36C79F|nr:MULTISPECIES: FadR/GntR family transcriptional regulator [Micrococcaceae]MCD4852036.1 FadR family transcriptional regulator [Arthrobacter sp. AK01]MCP1413744.1 DNA-binding FadR family transcriptional regulator [Paenarthrobacter sp. A20]
MTAKSTGRSVKALTSVKRVSPTQQIREQLLGAIERGEYPPGSALPSERELCETFGVSRVSVREAIAGLEAMKVITVQHGRGAFVQESISERYAGSFAKYLELHREQLIELTKVRGALESLAAEEAARHGDRDDLRAIEEAEREFEHAASAGDGLDAAERDRAFHLAIADASKGELLPRLIHELNDLLSESRGATFAQKGQLQKSVQDHRDISRAIAEGDPAAARHAVDVHMTRIGDWLSTLPHALSENGQRSPE